jgi:hypothetical protein
MNSSQLFLTPDAEAPPGPALPVPAPAPVPEPAVKNIATLAQIFEK